MRPAAGNSRDLLLPEGRRRRPRRAMRAATGTHKWDLLLSEGRRRAPFITPSSVSGMPCPVEVIRLSLCGPGADRTTDVGTPHRHLAHHAAPHLDAVGTVPCQRHTPASNTMSMPEVTMRDHGDRVMHVLVLIHVVRSMTAPVVTEAGGPETVARAGIPRPKCEPAEERDAAGADRQAGTPPPVCVGEGDPSRRPDRPPDYAHHVDRHPTPPVMRMPYPATVVVRQPAPRLAGDPHPTASITPQPTPRSVGRPRHHSHSRPPNATVFRHFDPVSVPGQVIVSGDMRGQMGAADGSMDGGITPVTPDIKLVGAARRQRPPVIIVPPQGLDPPTGAQPMLAAVIELHVGLALTDLDVAPTMLFRSNTQLRGPVDPHREGRQTNHYVRSCVGHGPCLHDRVTLGQNEADRIGPQMQKLHVRVGSETQDHIVLQLDLGSAAVAGHQPVSRKKRHVEAGRFPARVLALCRPHTAFDERNAADAQIGLGRPRLGFVLPGVGPNTGGQNRDCQCGRHECRRCCSRGHRRSLPAGGRFVVSYRQHPLGRRTGPGYSLRRLANSSD